MKTNFTPNQIKWASLHDWFISGTASEIVCRNEWNEWNDGRREDVKHTNFQSLRDWAGY